MGDSRCDAILHHFWPTCSLTTPLSSKGRNYSLSFSIYPTSINTPGGGVLFSGEDSILSAGAGSITKVILIASGNLLNSELLASLNTWTKASLSSRGNPTYFSVQQEQQQEAVEMEFLTKVGVNVDFFVWSEIAIEAPIARIGGDKFEGFMKEIELVDLS